MIDAASLFCAIFILSGAGVLWIADELSAIREANRKEAAFMRVIGWGGKGYWRR